MPSEFWREYIPDSRTRKKTDEEIAEQEEEERRVRLQKIYGDQEVQMPQGFSGSGSNLGKPLASLVAYPFLPESTKTEAENIGREIYLAKLEEATARGNRNLPAVPSGTGYNIGKIFRTYDTWKSPPLLKGTLELLGDPSVWIGGGAVRGLAAGTMTQRVSEIVGKVAKQLVFDSKGKLVTSSLKGLTRGESRVAALLEKSGGKVTDDLINQATRELYGSVLPKLAGVKTATIQTAKTGSVAGAKATVKETAERIGKVTGEGRRPYQAPTKAAKPIKKPATGSPIDVTLYRGESSVKPYFRLQEYGEGTYYYADIGGQEGLANKAARSYAAAQPELENVTDEAIQAVGGKVRQEIVRLNNPYVISESGDKALKQVVAAAKRRAIAKGLTGKEWDDYVAQSIPKYLKNKGYDGLIVERTSEGGVYQVIPYKPTTPAEAAVRTVAQTVDEDALLKDIGQRLNKYKPLREDVVEGRAEWTRKQATTYEEARKWAEEAGMSPQEARVHALKTVSGNKAPTPLKPTEAVITEDEKAILYKIIDRELPDLPNRRRVWDRNNAKEGLEKLLSKESLPEPREVELLEQAFGFDFVSQAFKRKRTIGEKVLTDVYGILNIPRSLKASFDLSAPLRQGQVLSFAHPIEAARSFKWMVQAVAKESDALFMDDLLHGRIGKLEAAGLSPDDALKYNAKARRRADHFLYLHDLRSGGENLAGREEAFISNIASKVPGVRPSERAYITYLNKLRSDVFDLIADSWEKTGKYTDETGKFNKALYDEDLTELARFINRCTGRGELWRGEYAKSGKAFQISHPGVLLNMAFFSPRLQTSRVLMFASLASSSKAVRMAAIRDLSLFVGVQATVMGLIAMHPDVTVETDPRSAQSWKLRIKDTYVDISAGFQPLIRYAANFFGGKKSQSGWISKPDPLTTAARFTLSKAHPVIGSIFTALSGQKFSGEALPDNEWKATGELFKDLLIPMSVDSWLEAGNEYGLLEGAAMSLPEIFGAGVQTYKTEESVVQDHYSMLSEIREVSDEWQDAYLEQDFNKMAKIESEHPELQMRYDTSTKSWYSNTSRVLNRYATKIGELNRQIHEIELNRGITNEEKKNIMEELEREKQIISATAILTVEELYQDDWAELDDALKKYIDDGRETEDVSVAVNQSSTAPRIKIPEVPKYFNK